MRKKEIIELAKELYLTPDEQGSHEYTLREIATEIRQKNDRKIHFATIGAWSEKYGWKKLWENGVRAGIIKEIKGKGEQEEKITEAISKKKQESAEDNSKLKVKAIEILLKSEISVSEAIKLYEITTRKEQEDLGFVSPVETLAEKILKKLLEKLNVS